jgi:hypothetical protein
MACCLLFLGTIMPWMFLDQDVLYYVGDVPFYFLVADGFCHKELLSVVK